MSRSWLDKEITERKYKVNSEPPSIWIVHNEYQVVKCPKCQVNQFCRLTLIFHLDAQEKPISRSPEVHTNYNESIDALKKLLVTYASEQDPDSGITEELIDGIWKLTCRGKIIGEEIEIRE